MRFAFAFATCVAFVLCSCGKRPICDIPHFCSPDGLSKGRTNLITRPGSALSLDVTTVNFENISNSGLESLIVEIISNNKKIPIAINTPDAITNYTERPIITDSPIDLNNIDIEVSLVPQNRLRDYIAITKQINELAAPFMTASKIHPQWAAISAAVEKIKTPEKHTIIAKHNLRLTDSNGCYVIFLLSAEQQKTWFKDKNDYHIELKTKTGAVGECPNSKSLPDYFKTCPKIVLYYNYALKSGPA